MRTGPGFASGKPCSPPSMTAERSPGPAPSSMGASSPRKRGICRRTDEARQGDEVDARHRRKRAPHSENPRKRADLRGEARLRKHSGISTFRRNPDDRKHVRADWWRTKDTTATCSGRHFGNAGLDTAFRTKLMPHALGGGHPSREKTIGSAGTSSGRSPGSRTSDGSSCGTRVCSPSMMGSSRSGAC